MRLPRPGRRATQVATGTGVSAGSLMALGAAAYGVIRAEARLARHTIGEPSDHPPDPTGVYGRYPGPSLRLVMLGDSSATGLGCDSPAQTPGALLAGGVARDLKRRVRLDVFAVVGARSADLDTQVAKALQAPVDLAVIMVGANDVTHRVWPGDAGAQLGRAVATLRAAGTVVVVGTCPDLGTVKPLLQPLKTVAAYWSRRMATAQAVAVAEHDGIAISLGSLLAEEFAVHADLWSADRFHPSPGGYRRVADVLLPSLLEGIGVGIPVSVPVSDAVYDVDVAAGVAAREPGVAVETVEGDEGVAAVGPGRLVRLVRRLPLVGRGAPDERDDEASAEEERRNG
ncbi:MAG: lipolytic enzyme family [Frankiales bacterium]|jgi:lysophospholipase L1-like esterase|nr:lipolytic enzyme family [Frankiales bacterium]